MDLTVGDHTSMSVARSFPSDTLLGEFLSRSKAMLLLGVRHADTLERIRQARPEIAVVLPGMKRRRYVRSRIMVIAKERDEQRRSIGSGARQADARVA